MEADIPRLSHEFGNLLTLVVGAYTSIGSRHPELTEEAHWDSMGADLASMRKLLEYFRGVTPDISMRVNEINRIEAEQETGLMEVVQELLPGIELLCEQNGLVFTFENNLKQGLDDIRVERLPWKLILLNLCKNAVEACDRGGKIILRLESPTAAEREAGKRIRITVSDDGEPVPRPLRELIFTDGFTTKPNGSGHGLSLVKQEVEARGGTIQLRSHPGCTEFVLTV